jgi:hypothetical protein
VVVEEGVVDEGTGVFLGFVTCIHLERPVLLHRFGWVGVSATVWRSTEADAIFLSSSTAP